MIRFLPDFPAKIKGLDFSTLEKSEQPIYVIDRNLDIIYVNECWVAFALANHGEKFLQHFHIGRSVLDAISGADVKTYYKNKYESVLETGEVWSQEYECSSPDEYREFHQKTYPLKNGEGLVIINTLAVNMPMEQKRKKEYAAIKERYIQESGFINQCSNCRQIQRVSPPDQWDWVPEWVREAPSIVSHSICPECFDYYWKYGSMKYEKK